MADIDNKEQSELDQDLDDVEEETEEGEWKPDEEDEISEELKEKAKTKDEKKDEEKDPKGIPEFWLTIFKNVDLLSDMVQEHDEPILKHLEDIKVKFSDAGQPMSFVLEFHFEPNEYFTNEVLIKTYRMKVSESGDLDDDFEAILTSDSEIGHFLRECIIPRSVLYFTGEAIEDDADDYDEGEKQASKYLIWKVQLIRKAALIVNNLSRPVTGWEPGAAGEPSKCHPVASDYGGRRSCRSPCPRAASRGASLRPPRARRPQEPAGQGRDLWADSLSWRPPLTPREPPAARLPSPTPNPQARKAQPPSGRCYHTPARRLASRPQLGCAGGAVGEPTRNPRKSGGGGRGPSSRAFETALLVLDGPRAAVLSNAISGSF
ncbi:hypothetical protein R6Z07M_007784 [Ovis aries]